MSNNIETVERHFVTFDMYIMGREARLKADEIRDTVYDARDTASSDFDQDPNELPACDFVLRSLIDGNTFEDFQEVESNSEVVAAYDQLVRVSKLNNKTVDPRVLLGGNALQLMVHAVFEDGSVSAKKKIIALDLGGLVVDHNGEQGYMVGAPGIDHVEFYECVMAKVPPVTAYQEDEDTQLHRRTF